MSIALFNPQVIEDFQHEIIKFPHVECAGLLLGKVENDGSTFHVLKTSGSGPKARHAGGFVTPDAEFLNREIMKGEMEGLEFLGEWHKHPGKLNFPTPGDIGTITEIMRDGDFAQYLAVIITKDQNGTEINTYLFNWGNPYKRIPCAIISAGLENSKIARAITGTAVKDSRKERTEERSEEGEKEQKQVRHGVLSWLFSRAFGKESTSSKKEAEVSSRQMWYETDRGRRRFALERRLMATKFPGFVLLRKAGVIFWKGAYKERTIVLKYPPDYPHQPLNVIIKPPVERIPKENRSYYATLAAQTAFLRIENSTFQKTTSLSKPETPIKRKATLWYETQGGRAYLAQEQRLLDHASLDFNLRKLSGGKLAFDVNLNERVSLVIICPANYPNAPPQVKASSRAAEVKLDIHSLNEKISNEWGKSFTSIYSVVKETMRSNKFRL